MDASRRSLEVLEACRKGNLKSLIEHLSTISATYKEAVASSATVLLSSSLSPSSSSGGGDQKRFKLDLISIRDLLGKCLLAAVKHSHATCVEAILETALSINPDELVATLESREAKSGRNSVHLAAGNGSTEIIYILLEYYDLFLPSSSSLTSTTSLSLFAIDTPSNLHSSCEVGTTRHIFHQLDNSNCTSINLASSSQRSSSTQLLLRYQSCSCLTSSTNTSLLMKPSSCSSAGISRYKDLIYNSSSSVGSRMGFRLDTRMVLDDEATPFIGAKGRTLRGISLYHRCQHLDHRASTTFVGNANSKYNNNYYNYNISGSSGHDDDIILGSVNDVSKVRFSVTKAIAKCSNSLQDIVKEHKYHQFIRDRPDLGSNSVRLLIPNILVFKFTEGRCSVSTYDAENTNMSSCSSNRSCSGGGSSSGGDEWYGIVIERGFIDLHKSAVTLNQKYNTSLRKLNSVSEISESSVCSWKIRFALHVCNFVKLLHSHGKVWLDVKLSNFLVMLPPNGANSQSNFAMNDEKVIFVICSGDYSVKAIDLGGALDDGSFVRSEEASFTMKYGAPELIRFIASATNSTESAVAGGEEDKASFPLGTKCTMSSKDDVSPPRFQVSKFHDLWAVGMCLLQLEDENMQSFYSKVLKLNHSTDVLDYLCNSSSDLIQSDIDNYIDARILQYSATKRGIDDEKSSFLLKAAKSLLRVDAQQRHLIIFD